MTERSDATRKRSPEWEAARKRAQAALAEMTPEEDATITADALSDPDNPPLTDADFARMRPAAEVLPKSLLRRRGERGPQKAPTKTLVSIRLSPEVLDHFRADGEGWQTRIDDALRDVVAKQHRRA